VEGGGEDRFGDLGAPERESSRPSAAERLADEDRREQAAAAPPKPAQPSGRYAWFVGIVFFIAIVVALFTTLPNSGEGLQGPEPGTRLPEFAAPLATGTLEGDANIRPATGGSAEAGPVPACAVRSDQVMNLCELRRRPLVLTFIFDRGADCKPQVDRVERMKGDFPGVNFAAVFFSREDRDEVREIVRRRGWTQPVALDRDGQIANLYGVGGCPTTVFAEAGGKVRETRLGNLTEEQLRRSVRGLSRARARPRERG
jgi:hypothetical protein